jgi:hypothetical protein
VVDIDHMLSNIDARIKAATANVIVADVDSIVNRNDRKSTPSSVDAPANNRDASVAVAARKANPYINRDAVDVKGKVQRAAADSDGSEEDDDGGEEVLLVGLLALPVCCGVRCAVRCGAILTVSFMLLLIS